MYIEVKLKYLNKIAEDKSEKYTDLEKALARKALDYHKNFQEKSEWANELFQAIYSSFCIFGKKGLILRLITKKNNDPNTEKVYDSNTNHLDKAMALLFPKEAQGEKK
jgi:5'(3')-deoxyribonucleotidase